MPRDDFASLERRWREQPLFLARRRRPPRWPLAVALLALSVALGSILLGQKQVAALIAGLEAAFDAHATQSTAPSDSAAGLSASAKNRATDAVGR
jgi:hypothetical protein